MSDKKENPINFAAIAALCTGEFSRLKPCDRLLRNNSLCSVSTGGEKKCNYHSSTEQVQLETNFKFTILRILDDALSDVIADGTLTREEVIEEKKMLVQAGLRSTLAGTFEVLPQRYKDKSGYELLKALFRKLIVGDI